jgi:acetyl esterase/lipase
MSAEILTLPAPPADHRIPYGPDPSQFGDLRMPPGGGPHPVVVYLHGGFWRAAFSLEHAGHICAALTAHGMATWSLEYRRIGQPGGAWPGTFEDVARGADYLRKLTSSHPLDADRVIAMGHSAGGHLALWLAARHRIPPGSPLHFPQPLALRGAVSLAGVCDLRRGSELGLSNGVVHELLGGTPWEVPDRYETASPAESLPLGVRQVLIHGTADDRVPYEVSEGYRDAALASGDDVDLITLPAADHFELIDPRSSVWPIVLRAVQGLIG